MLLFLEGLSANKDWFNSSRFISTVPFHPIPRSVSYPYKGIAGLVGFKHLQATSISGFLFSKGWKKVMKTRGRIFLARNWLENRARKGQNYLIVHTSVKQKSDRSRYVKLWESWQTVGGRLHLSTNNGWIGWTLLMSFDEWVLLLALFEVVVAVVVVVIPLVLLGMEAIPFFFELVSFLSVVAVVAGVSSLCGATKTMKNKKAIPA